MAYSQDIQKEKPIFEAFATTTAASGSTGEIDLKGGTLDGVLFEGDITSTAFTISVSRVEGGTYVTVKDGLGQFGTAGSNLTYTMGATSTGYIPISPLVTAGFRFCKIVLNSSEAITLYVSRRNLQ